MSADCNGSLGGASPPLRAGVASIALLALGCHALAPLADGQGATRLRPPNIVLIVADDQGFADVDLRQPGTDMPQLRRLAESGVFFDQAYVTHPYCSPSRAGMMTGRYQQRFGHETNPPYSPHDEHIGLPVEEATLATRLKRRGYQTAFIGKWHLGAAAPFHPLRRGFDHFFGFLGGGHDYFVSSERSPSSELEEYTTPIEVNADAAALDGYLTDHFSGAAVRFIEEATSGRDQGPFFLALSFNAPHFPYQAPAPYCDQVVGDWPSPCATYRAMLWAVDAGVGRLLDAVDRAHVRQQTLVFFLSDNGGSTLFGCADNGELRGHKAQLYEGGLRVPFVVSWPTRVEGDRRSGMLVSALDIAMTSLVAAGSEETALLDGVDLLARLDEGSEETERALFWRLGARGAVRWRQWKLHLARSGEELYDLTADPAEERDVSSREADVVDKLSREWRAWNATLAPPRWTDPPSAALLVTEPPNCDGASRVYP